VVLLLKNQGRHFSFFQGGQSFDRLPNRGGGQNIKFKKSRQKHQKVTIFQNQGGGANATLVPPK